MQIFTGIHKPMNLQGSENSVKTDRSVSEKGYRSQKSTGSIKKYQDSSTTRQ